jgi:type I restriction enzyme S subunit
VKRGENFDGLMSVTACDTITIEEATERLIDYRGKTPPKTDDGIRLVTAKVVKDGYIHEAPKEYIAADFYDEWMRRGLPQRLDVLLSSTLLRFFVAKYHQVRLMCCRRLWLGKNANTKFQKL